MRISPGATDLTTFDDLESSRQFQKSTGPWAQTTIRSMFNDPVVEPKRDFRMYAFIGSWYDGDLIAANVLNCKAHGFDRVYVLDNASPDNTVANAVGAGATEIRSWASEYYLEDRRVELISRWIKEVIERERNAEVWVACLDSDEFIQVPGQQTLREYIGGLDPIVNILGLNAIEHVPMTDGPNNVPGEHPAKYQPNIWLRNRPCSCNTLGGHWKHSVIKLTDGRFDVLPQRGFHLPLTKPGRFFVEPMDTLYLHHTPFREESFTRKRLAALCGGDPGSRRSKIDETRIDAEGAIKRFQSLDDVYAGRYDRIPVPHSQGIDRKVGIDVQHWTKLMDPRDYLPLSW